MRASPESFRRMRRNTGTDISGRLYQRGRGGGSRIRDNPRVRPLQEEGRTEDLLLQKTPVAKKVPPSSLSAPVKVVSVQRATYAVSPSLNRTNLGTEMFSPIFAIACCTS